MTATASLSDLKAGDWVVRERRSFDGWDAWMTPLRVLDRGTIADGSDVVLVSGRNYRITDGTATTSDYDRIRLPTPEEIAAHEAHLAHEASIDRITVEVPKGMTAADVQHRLATWQGLRDACHCVLDVPLQNYWHGFDGKRARDILRAALAAADRETP